MWTIASKFMISFNLIVMHVSSSSSSKFIYWYENRKYFTPNKFSVIILFAERAQFHLIVCFIKIILLLLSTKWKMIITKMENNSYDFCGFSKRVMIDWLVKLLFVSFRFNDRNLSSFLFVLLILSKWKASIQWNNNGCMFRC